MRGIFKSASALLALLLLAGCASFAETARFVAPPTGYWKRMWPVAWPVTAIIEKADVNAECTGSPAQKNIRVNRCFHFVSGKVFLRKGMSPEKRACVLSHEALGKFSHASGYDHSGQEYRDPRVPIDCGDGTLLMDDGS
jgi:hypothetical protein